MVEFCVHVKPSSLDLWVRLPPSSSIGSIAQLVEHGAFNAVVDGSSPSAPTNYGSLAQLVNATPS